MKRHIRDVFLAGGLALALLAGWVWPGGTFGQSAPAGAGRRGEPAAVGGAWMAAMSPALAAAEGDDDEEPAERDPADGLEEADDDATHMLGAAGAISIPVSIARDGQATIALYTPSGQLVRILGQLLELRKGTYKLRWDGLDLWGNLVPAGTDLVCKVITHREAGVKAYYEFTVAAACDPPWTWMADHSAPNSATALGDRVILGAMLAEFGRSIVAVDLKGDKLWGMGLDGWSGPSLLANDGKDIFALHRMRTKVYRIDAAGKGRQPVYDSGADKITALAVREGKMYLGLRNQAREQSPFRMALGNGMIDFAASRPQVLETGTATEFMISPQAAFGNVFTTPGNPQNGGAMVSKDGAGYTLVVFGAPVAVGSLVLGGMDHAERLRVFALKPGLKFDAEKHSPLRDNPEGLGGLDLSDFDADWVAVGQSEVTQGFNFVPAAKADLKTTAIYLRVDPKKGAPRDWRPRLKMARILPLRVQRLPVAPVRTVLSEGLEEAQAESPRGRSPAWSFRSSVPVSDIYPAQVVLDYGQARSFDGLALLNCVTPQVAIEALAGDQAGVDPLSAEARWTVVGQYRGGFNRKLGYLSASRDHNEAFVRFDQRLTTRALRFRITEGYRAGKWGRGSDDSFRGSCDDVALLQLVDDQDRPPGHLFRVVSLADGKVLSEQAGDHLALSALAFAPDGELLALSGSALCRAKMDTAGLKLEPMAVEGLRQPISLAVDAGRIVVGDAERRAVLVLGRDGKGQRAIGDRGPRVAGAWDPRVIERPSALAIDPAGKLWVAEERFCPKRVARYDLRTGAFEREWLGPPMYGGGGQLDPNLKSFYYRSMEFALDFAQGTSRLANLNDRLLSEPSPSLEDNYFRYSGIGRPLYHKGKRYMAGGSGGGLIVSLLEGPTVRACAVMGPAAHSPFLLGKASWNKHWGRLHLTGKFFIWCDRNDDGQYQVEEVELFEPREDLGGNRPFAGAVFGPDLAIWGNAFRLQPARFTAGGVPIYERKGFVPFDYEKLAPVYSRNYTLGAPRSAKPTYSAFKRILADGSLIQEGQPYLVGPDLAIRGGDPKAKPSDYIPRIPGTVLNQPWCFAGGAQTRGDLGEVAVVNSNNGYWYVWAANYGVIVGSFFTGKTGGWGWGMPAQRGMDVTGRKHAWEAWGADFVQADNGQCYTVAGKGFHGISRIEGLDGYQVASVPVKVTAESLAINTRLRPILKMQSEAPGAARAKGGAKTATCLRLPARTTGFKLDGDLDDWGGRKKMLVIGDEKQHLFFDLAYDDQGLYLGYAGASRLGNRAEDLRYLFKGGFCFDLMYRADSRNSSRDPVAGDRRIVFGKYQGKWTAVLYDYVDPKAAAADEVVFESPVMSTSVARVAALQAHQFKLVVKEAVLDLDPGTLKGLEGFGDEPALPGSRDTRKPAARPKGYADWTAEAFLPWSVLGIKPEGTLRLDVGVLSADPSGEGVESRTYWSNRSTGHVVDVAVEAAITPGAWGTVTFGR